MYNLLFLDGCPTYKSEDEYERTLAYDILEERNLLSDVPENYRQVSGPFTLLFTIRSIYSIVDFFCN